VKTGGTVIRGPHLSQTHTHTHTHTHKHTYTHTSEKKVSSTMRRRADINNSPYNTLNTFGTFYFIFKNREEPEIMPQKTKQMIKI